MKGHLTRNYPLDLLRVLACYLVIHQHASEFYYIGNGGTVVPGDGTFWIGIITSVARISVPLFVMISGFLLLPMKGTTSDFFKKRFTRILFPFVIWCTLYALYYVFYRGDSWTTALQNILHIPVNFGVEVGHLWYIYMLIGLYLIVPILSPWVAGCSRNELRGYLALWGVTTFLPYIHLVYPQLWGECFWNPTPTFYYLNGFVGFLLLGYYIKRFGALSLPYAVGCTVVGYAITAGVFCSRISTSAMVPQLELSWGFCTANVAILAYGVFSLCMHVSVQEKGIIGRLLQDISLKSYGIYLAHIMLLNVFYQWLHPVFPQVYIAIPVISVCTFICIYAGIKLLSYLPYSKFWIG